MNDPKYLPTDSGIRHISGDYLIPEDEPIMILRGKDIGALSAICDYIDMLQDQDMTKTIRDHLASSSERLVAFYRYQRRNPDLQSVGCSRVQHSTSSAMLNAALVKIEELKELGILK